MKQRLVRFGGAILLATAMAACSGTNSIPLASSPSSPQMKLPPAGPMVHGIVEVTAADREMARHFVPGQPHITLPAFKHQAASAGKVGYPLDMTCQTSQCPVMTSSTAFNIYVTPDGKTCKNEKCWGDPEEFLKALTGSPLAGVAQQYTGGAATAYKYGGHLTVKLGLAYSNTFYNEQLFTVLAAAAKHFQKIGLNYQYHLFLPPGTDTCFDQYGICYSPDNLTAFAFCAYHSAVLFNGQPIVYSVEPWQNAQVTIGGKKFYACQNTKVPPGTNRLNSSTASTLSHESFEAWSDPLPNSGWFNAPYGEEIGDVCAYRFMTKFAAGGGSWLVQQEYSNSAHGCADTP
jgi:hypothetical protein